MNPEREIAATLARRFDTRWLRGYVRSKVRTDPAYWMAWEILRQSEHPVLDVGCGIGLLPFYLRERGFRGGLKGIDTDRQKIETARKVAAEWGVEADFEVSDGSRPVEFSGNVALLDVLHYLEDPEQRRLLNWVAELVPPGGVVIIRDCPRDRSWRYRFTWLEEVFARSIGWMRTTVLNFPTAQSIAEPFLQRGFEEDVRPLWGRTPFNSYLFLYRRFE